MIVPGNTDASMPLLRWDLLLETAVTSQGNALGPFVDWFQEITGTAANLELWLSCIAGLLGQTAPVTGAGSQASPFVVPLLSVAGVGTLSLTAATAVGPSAQQLFYPGLQFTASPIALGTSSAVLQVVADVQLFEFVLSAQGSGGANPSSLSFDLGITLQNSDPKNPLVSSGGYELGSLSAGLSLGIGTQPVPSFTLTSVSTPAGTLPASIYCLLDNWRR